MTNNIQKAKELINCFASGDVAKAKSLLKEDYIQHNLAYGTGREAFCGSVAYLGSAPVKTTVNTVRAFEDGDKDLCRQFIILQVQENRWRSTSSASRTV